MDTSLRALNRFGMGAGIGEARRLGDPRAWLRAQVTSDAALLRDHERPPTIEDASSVLQAVQVAQRSGDQDAIRTARQQLQILLVEERTASMKARVTSEAPFTERLVAFWSNHLCVSVTAKQQVVPLAGLYERGVVRPHLFGRFEDMVQASARHPAMLLYLDNAQSMGPNSRAAQALQRRGGAERGLNENYARELLELHTLGVNGGYTQGDVEQLALIFTGWSIEGLVPREQDRTLGYLFRTQTHEPGAKTVLGRSYREWGEGEGEQVIHDLCVHPQTADFIATKLVRHFVADDPPRDAVEEIREVFRGTAGDLGAVSLALVDLEAAWNPETRKLRSPQDWLAAVLRTFYSKEVTPQITQVLRQLRHPVWGPSSPKGFGDEVRDWADPDSLMNRAELARSVARRVSRDLRRSGVEVAAILDVMDLADSDPLPAMLRDESIPLDERLALAIGGPAFQWR